MATKTQQRIAQKIKKAGDAHDNTAIFFANASHKLGLAGFNVRYQRLYRVFTLAGQYLIYHKASRRLFRL